jgi:hypothetical protein
MVLIDIIWDLDDDPEGNVQHIAEHDISKEEVEDVLFNPKNPTVESRSSGNPTTFGYTSAGRHIAVIWERINDSPLIAYPITAYDTPEPC